MTAPLPPNLQEAAEILEKVRGKPQTIAERKRLSVALSSLLLHEAGKEMTSEERKAQAQLSRLMQDPIGKAFTNAMTDEAFRSHSHRRVADQMLYLLHQYGVPKYLSWFKQAQLFAFKLIPITLSRFLIPLAMRELRNQTARVILPSENGALTKHIRKRISEGVQLNLNHLGEAILSEEEANARIQLYLDDLMNPSIDYVSIKISTIFSQINLLAWDYTIESIAARLKLLYRAAIENSVEGRPKFINLDMEEYRDLHLTVDVFKKVLEDAEFCHLPAGIVLQAYLPDSYQIQKDLTTWAKKRIENGGSWIKIRIVKGANLAMEQFEASSKGWAQAPYASKLEVDANYKRMVSYGCTPENARAVRLGIASHNLFDIAFAMLLRVENQVEAYTGFEMLEGMADHIRRVVQKLTGTILLYCPVARKEEFQHAIAYLVRRLDENTGPENFLRHLFGLKPDTESWDNQTVLFNTSCDEIDTVSAEPRRNQNRLLTISMPEFNAPFDNEVDTDFSLKQNVRWVEEIAKNWKQPEIKPLPIVIGGNALYENQAGVGFSPNNPNHPLYNYAKATKEQIQEAISSAKAYENQWGATTIEHRSQLLARVAQKIRERRSDFTGVLMTDAGKIATESDPEISEAIDFAEYYRRQMEKFGAMKDIQWTPKGTILVTPPWNFPVAIPAGGILAALMTGNCVLFKPASDTVLVGWHLVNAMWDAGIPKEALQFVPCSGEEVGSELILDKRVNCVILTGGTETGKKFLKMRPGLDLAAELGGKNAMIVTALSDRDLAVKDILHSAFSHCGQKCSAVSLAILEAEVYDDCDFLDHLRNAAKSLKLGPTYELPTKIGPLIHVPRGDLKRGLTQLDEGEQWLLEPKQDTNNPALWSPGIKLGVKSGSFSHLTEFFGPVLSIMRADDLAHAVQLANEVPFGLTSGLESLDEREQLYWLEHIEAGNLYINRTTTGAIVRRQPFGGTKGSSIGGAAKAGGPNYIREFMHAKQVGLPQEKAPVNEWVNNLTISLNKIELTAEQLGIWGSSIYSYAYWWARLRQDRDPNMIVGQDNFFRYVPRKGIVLRIGKDTSALDALRSAAAALTVGAEFEISWSSNASKQKNLYWLEQMPLFKVIQENEETFLQRVAQGKIQRIRMAEHPSDELKAAAAKSCTYIIDAPVLANGRLELLHYLREIAICIDYHRYGNLGQREDELRKPIL
jgi:RHH-type proline utilization regulon transcriptional repressor/proline dehydrogenase/delta 1-pyrroline-5-carboxylate dehydrogenase